MNQTPDLTQEHFSALRTASHRIIWWRVAVLVLLIGCLYYKILTLLVLDWWNDPDFSHGFFVPAFSAFVIWQERKRLAATPIRPSWLGLVVIAGALGTLILGVLGVELFLSRSSFVLLVGGFVIFMVGWRWFRTVLFPWAFLFLMIPIPTIVFNKVAFPLQLLASRLASLTLAFLDVPVLREGNIIQLPAMPLEVAQACSGIRSLISLGTLALIYGYFLEPRVPRRVLLVIAAVPIAVVANGLRVVGTGLLVHYWNPAEAEGFFHTFSGWIIFVISLGLLVATHSAMCLLDRTVGRRKA